jgi:hypothetical protein
MKKFEKLLMIFRFSSGKDLVEGRKCILKATALIQLRCNKNRLNIMDYFFFEALMSNIIILLLSTWSGNIILFVSICENLIYIKGYEEGKPVEAYNWKRNYLSNVLILLILRPRLVLNYYVFVACPEETESKSAHQIRPGPYPTTSSMTHWTYRMIILSKPQQKHEIN